MAQYDVNIDLANQAKKEMSDIIATADPRVLNRLGAFSALFEVDFSRYRQPILVLKTEEPGSKQLLAMQYDRIEGVCHDMINHLVNDCVVMGAEPLTVQDAIICGKMDKEIITRIVRSLTEACRNNDCILTGGETSEQPKVLGENTYILTSSIVGIVEKSDILDGSAIEAGDIVLSLASNGVHTNGYTLVRTILAEHPELLTQDIDGETFLDAVLKPHRAYYPILRGLFSQHILHGLAHITGGGIRENLNRILPSGLDAQIDLSAYKIPTIFRVLREVGQVSDAEMLRTFNMGVGIAAVTAPAHVDTVIAHCQRLGVACMPIGVIQPGNQTVQTVGTLRWK